MRNANCQMKNVPTAWLWSDSEQRRALSLVRERLPSLSINGPVAAMPTKMEGFQAEVLVFL